MYSKPLCCPSRFSPQEQHNAYGLQNWFVEVGVPVKDHELQQEIMDNFCETKGAKFQPGKQGLKKQINFINNRFQEFTKWAHKNYELKPLGYRINVGYSRR